MGQSIDPRIGVGSGPDVIARSEATVFLVDPDPVTRASTAAILVRSGFQVRAGDAGAEVLACGLRDDIACVVTDLRLADMDGLALQARLSEEAAAIPVVFVAASADVGDAVRAMKAGAFDFLQRPLDELLLARTIRHALDHARRVRGQYGAANEAAARIGRLSRREREVLEHLVEGRPNKAIAAQLNISRRTVEIHRANLMRKTGLRSVSELVRAAIAIDGMTAAR